MEEKEDKKDMKEMTEGMKKDKVTEEQMMMLKSLPKKHGKGNLNGRQALVLKPDGVETVTRRLCDWGGCGTDMGFKKHMEVKHGKEPEYWLIPPLPPDVAL